MRLIVNVPLTSCHAYGRLPRVERIAPIFPVKDLQAAMEHYRRLGFSVWAYPGGGYGFAAWHGMEIHLDADARGASPSSAYMFVDDADVVAATWRSVGAEVDPPRDQEWGQREGWVIDPDGNRIYFGSPLE
jgi:hypothetical protein